MDVHLTHAARRHCFNLLWVDVDDEDDNENHNDDDDNILQKRYDNKLKWKPLWKYIDNQNEYDNEIRIEDFYENTLIIKMNIIMK